MGNNQNWNADEYDRHGRFVSDYGDVILGWLAPQRGEHILDAGCGDGALTEKISESGAVVEGVEVAPSMVAAARLRGLTVREMDLLSLDDNGQYDAIFSNAVLHWIGDWPSLLLKFKRALKPGGRLVVECGGFGNIAAIRTAICAVARESSKETKAAAEMYLTCEEADHLLNAAGFKVQVSELQMRQTYLKTGIKGWLSVFRASFLEQFEEGPIRDEVLDKLESLLLPQLSHTDPLSGARRWYADYVRLRFICTCE
ncbi:MAG: methyltransferase type 11 [Rhodomicrobium sp.]|nr:MAG: methyltransferase type 11 [Rhodomicrobium sp.]